MKKILSTLFTVVAVLMFAVSAQAANVTLGWDAPTTNEDGSELTDLAGYRVYSGQASRDYSSSFEVPAGTTTAIVTGLGSGMQYFAITAYNTSGRESVYSDELSIDIFIGSSIAPSVPSGLAGECAQININTCLGCFNTCE